MSFAEAIYLLCALTSLVAAGLLLRYYLVARGGRLLLWSCVGFLGLAVNNVLVYVDLAVFTDVTLAVPRALAGAAGMLALAYGLATEPRQ